MRPAFERLTYLFEYIWYGDFPATRASVLQMEQAFITLRDQLESVGAHA